MTYFDKDLDFCAMHLHPAWVLAERDYLKEVAVLRNPAPSFTDAHLLVIAGHDARNAFKYWSREHHTCVSFGQGGAKDCTFRGIEVSFTMSGDGYAFIRRPEPTVFAYPEGGPTPYLVKLEEPADVYNRLVRAAESAMSSLRPHDEIPGVRGAMTRLSYGLGRTDARAPRS